MIRKNTKSKGGKYVIYNAGSDVIELSVEELCRAAISDGDIDCRHSAPAYRERASEHSKIYNKLHLAHGMQYYDSVELSNTCCLDGIYFCVAGRADGILCRDGSYTVDEVSVISGKTYVPREVDEYHNARLSCYAYFLSRAKNVQTVRARRVFYNSDEGDFEYEYRDVISDDLRATYMRMLMKVLWRARLMRHRVREILPAAANAVFPYKTLRESQEEMIRECYRDIKHGNRLFCQAPTGIGKTVSTLYPSVKCVGEGVADKIFYLTSKQSIRREAVSAMKKLNSAGVGVRSCVISSRESMCPNAAAKLRGGRLSSNCNPDLCPYAKGYYDRSESAIEDIVASGDCYDSNTVRAFAQKHRVCPYELSLDLSELCDTVICDYNYVFSPTVYLKRYFDGREDGGEKYIFLVDEAHNLPDRAREMFSSKLSVEDFWRLGEALEEESALFRACRDVIDGFAVLGHLCDDNEKYLSNGQTVAYSVTRELPPKICEILDAFSKKCDNWLKYNTDHPAFFIAEDLGYKLFEFKKIIERYDKQYITFINRTGASVSILMYCLDPSKQLSLALDRSIASIMFSATLTPTEYFADILGGGKRTVSVEFRSPFPSENMCVAVVDGVSTRYEDREKSYRRISSCIAATVSAKAGNYMVFFPSYSYMEEVKKIFTAKYPKVTVLEQKRNMSQAQKEEFISSFADDSRLRIGFCVLGGSFSEGIDLPGRRLIGVIVVGVGLPGLSNENNIIRDYYEEKCGMGYDYAYTYPGMNGVLQAVGRVIRTETDKGIAVLIDDRYAEQKYRQLFPSSWKGVKIAGNASSLAEIARRFWEKG